MKIIRYSPEGFKPQHQSHHLKDIYYHLNDFNLSEYPIHLQPSIKKIHLEKVEFYTKNYKDFQYGVWAFIDGYKDNQSLNHSTRKVPCWEAEISDNTLVYHVNWDKQMIITDCLCKIFGFYIPESQLGTLNNIRRRLKSA